VDISDEQLVESWRLGDPVAMEILLRRHQDRLYAYFYHLSGDRSLSEDLLQETVLHICRGLRDFDPTKRFTTWTFAIATNIWRDHLRRERRQWLREEELGSVAEEEARIGLRPRGYTVLDALADLESRELQEEARQALRYRSEEHRVVIVLKHYEELSYQEIGEILGCPAGTVKSRLHYALDRLRHLFIKRGLL